ncbi:hypothetical protein PRNP1_009769 [Phytophthora ramorum]
MSRAASLRPNDLRQCNRSQEEIKVLDGLTSEIAAIHSNTSTAVGHLEGAMQPLQEHLHIPVKNLVAQHAQLVHAPNEPLRMIPFKFSYLHLFLFAVLVAATGGILLVLSVWYPLIFTYLARSQLPLSSAGDADYMLVLVYGKGLHAQWVECPVHRQSGSTTNETTKSTWIWFEFKKHRYVYSLEDGGFKRYLATINEDLAVIYARLDNGLKTVEVDLRLERFGENRVLIDKPRIPKLLCQKLIAPFYIFQVISAIIWFIEEYTIYAIIIILLSAASIINEIYCEVSNSNRLRRLVRSDCSIDVVRAGTTTQVHESEIVPGDIVIVHEGPVCADILILSGLCVADEASLTGEALPVNKEPAVGAGQVTEYNMEYLNEKVEGNYIAVVTSEEDESKKYGVLKRFAFDAAHQRSSTIVEDLETKKRFVVVKGSPEAIRAISVTTPTDLHQKVHSYSADGYYCIGFGMKELSSSSTAVDVIHRDEVECAVEFLGLAIFKNELKPETKGMLDELQEAKIDVRIITGDNALTAVHVCRELNMPLKPKIAVVDVDATTGGTVFISADAIKTSANAQWESFSSSNMEETMAEYDLAITGAALENMRNDCSDDTVRRIIKQTPIFARVRPQQKTWIVEQLIDTGLIVGMCGDGTNDCGALKAAHVGLALSSAEASIVAPFTSKAKAILDVPVLLREGRCALTTSFQSFKFMCLYPIIQLGMAIVLAHVGSDAGSEVLLTNNQYVWDDIAIVLGLSIAMLYTGPAFKLSPEKPPSTLFSLSIVASIIGQVAVFIAGFAAALAILHQEDSWFCSVKDGLAYVNGENSTALPNCEVFENYDMEALEHSYEDTTTWLFVHLTYIVVAIAFDLERPLSSAVLHQPHFLHVGGYWYSP